MKRVMLTFAVLALLISGYANATTYTYTGAYFTDGGGPDYEEGMRVTGTLVTSSPIPPNFSGDISDIMTSWSFSDGVQTIDSSNGEFSPEYPPQVLTNEEGLIVDSFLAFFLSPIATTVGDTDSYIGVVFSQSIGVIGAVCLTVVDGVCTTYEEPTSFAQAEDPGVWVTSATSTAIPTLSQWSLILLALILGMFGIVRFRRQV